jgi:hypothetical protein
MCGRWGDSAVHLAYLWMVPLLDNRGCLIINFLKQVEIGACKRIRPGRWREGKPGLQLKRPWLCESRQPDKGLFKGPEKSFWCSIHSLFLYKYFWKNEKQTQVMCNFPEDGITVNLPSGLTGNPFWVRCHCPSISGDGVMTKGCRGYAAGWWWRVRRLTSEWHCPKCHIDHFKIINMYVPTLQWIRRSSAQLYFEKGKRSSWARRQQESQLLS